MMHHGRDSSLSSISRSFNDNCSIASSGSSSPYVSPGGSPRESLNNQFSNSMSLQPPQKSTGGGGGGNNNTFVHKLYNMVVDNQYQHLIAWNYTGSSFIVCNIMEFSRDVLPKHFKHNNFSSFVRQLNMYGFHKVNKSPRGRRTLAENQIWEFSHQKFIKDRPDYLDEIKRKSLETETTRRDHGDINSHMAMMQVSQSEMVQQLARLQDNFAQVVRELAETKNKQHRQQQVLKSMMDFLSTRHGAQLQVPPELNINGDFVDMDIIVERPPSIFITSHDTSSIPQYYNNNMQQRQQQQQNHQYTTTTNTTITTTSTTNNTRNIPPALTVQTHNLTTHQQLSPGLSPTTIMVDQQNSPALSAYHTALNTPVSPSPSPFISDDDIPSLYSPHSPMTPNTFAALNQQNTFYNNTNQQVVDNNNNLVMMDHHSIVGAAYNNNNLFAVGATIQRTG